MGNNGKTQRRAQTPCPILHAESVDTPEPGNRVMIATPFQVFGATWLGEVDGKTWTLTDACRLMDGLAGGEDDDV